AGYARCAHTCQYTQEYDGDLRSDTQVDIKYLRQEKQHNSFEQRSSILVAGTADCQHKMRNWFRDFQFFDTDPYSSREAGVTGTCGERRERDFADNLHEFNRVPFGKIF